MHRRFGTGILLSLGPDGALLVDGGAWFAHGPIVHARNPVGSGDALLGAYLWARDRGKEREEALRIAVAAGADNARRGGGGATTLEGMEELARTVTVDRVG